MLLDLVLIFYVVFSVLFNLAQLYLFKILPSLNPRKLVEKEPFVSIIVPAKDEGKKIKECIDSLINQEYTNKEIIVVLGDSRDETEEILSKFRGKIKIIKEPKLEEGWVGKNWACYQGYKISKGEFLLFTDADTIHSKNLLKKAISAMYEEDLDFLTLIPSLEMRSNYVKLMLPVIGQFVYIATLAPLFNERNKKAVFGNGQFMLFKRSSYEKIGGHFSVKNKLLEDFNLAKLMKMNGLRTKLYNALSDFKVRMYDNIKELKNGWSKNLYIGLKANVFYLIISILILFMLYLFPIFLFIYGLYEIIVFNNFKIFIYSLILNLFYLFRFGIMYYKLNTSFIFGFIYFIPISFMIYLLIHSYFNFRKGITWKGVTYKGKEVI